MAGFFKKALSVFVEFDETAEQTNDYSQSVSSSNVNANYSESRISINKDELDKFGKHFESLLEKANLPGPDYFEFIKTIDVLETHISDEKLRITAAFASLNAQGLSKDKLISSAEIYKTIIEKDKINFEGAVNDKMKAEVESRKNEQKSLSQKIKENTEAIRKLNAEISQAQAALDELERLIADSNNKIKTNMENYQYACNAILKKITDDIEKIKSLT